MFPNELNPANDPTPLAALSEASQLLSLELGSQRVLVLRLQERSNSRPDNDNNNRQLNQVRFRRPALI